MSAKSSEPLRKALLKVFRMNPNREFTFQSLYLKVKPDSMESLALALDDLVKWGDVVRVFRVESPKTHIGIGDFGTLDEIPSVLFDRTSEEDVSVDPDNVHPIFRPV